MTGPPTRWSSVPLPDESRVQSLAGALSVPLPLARLLVVRGHELPDDAKRYLRPTLEQLSDPALLRDLPEAADRLSRAVRSGEVILVHGDYDVDGICSTTVMVRTIRALGGVVVPFIPDRRTDGYDLSAAGVTAAVQHGAGVVLTCDCGTTAVGASRALAAEGIDLIITDHHLPGPDLPPALAFVNPRRVDDTSPDKDLAAVGVAFKLALHLTRVMGGNENVVYNLLDLVALATIADVAPLRGENRVFVRRGLALMAESASAGVRALIRSAGLEGKEITAGRVGYILAPRLNALGRLDRAMRGVELLLADSEEDALGIARFCEELNRERQDLDRAILDQALKRVDTAAMRDRVGLVLADANWHPGVIGIAASRLVERTARPVFLISLQDGVGKGSGRSIPAFDLHAALGACADLLMKHGGHRAAAGLTIDGTRVDEFTERFDAVARAQLTPDDLVRELRVDLTLPLEEATEDLERLLRHLEPFGVGNPGPQFRASRVQVTSRASRIGNDGIKVTLQGPNGRLDAVGWGMADRASELAPGNAVDLLFRLERNEYRGRSALQLGLTDFRPSS